MEKVVVIYGPPGSGKSTQANLVAENLGLIHFDTGKYIEQVVHDPNNKKNKIIQKEREKFDSGILCDPSWVLKIVRAKASQLAKAGFGLVFSGSPRTVFEAFGDEKNEGLISVLERLYGRENIVFIVLKVSPKASFARNGSRQICTVCGKPILGGVYQGKLCPFCGALLRRRTLDKPEIIKVRLKEYQERTEPILIRLEATGHKVSVVNGEPPPHKVFAKILKILNLKS